MFGFIAWFDHDRQQVGHCGIAIVETVILLVLVESFHSNIYLIDLDGWIGVVVPELPSAADLAGDFPHVCYGTRVFLPLCFYIYI